MVAHGWNPARIRFAMGFAQMAGATLTVVLIASEGLTVTALYAGVLTTLVAVVSLLLFGGPMSNKE